MTKPAKPWSFIEAPSILGLAPTGVEQLPAALRAAGLDARLRPTRVTRVEPLAYDPRRDDETGILNPEGLVTYAHRLADAVGDALDRGERPLVLGGDCTILLGNLLALARRGQARQHGQQEQQDQHGPHREHDRYGLLFFDGHADFYQPSANINGQGASSELALATGRGPAALTRIDPRLDGPLVPDAQVVAIGMRDEEEAAAYESEPLPEGLRAYDLRTLRRVGLQRAMQEALDHLRPHTGGLWIHFDADVLSDDVMPAVDYRLPDGLSWREAETLLRAAFASGSIVGMDVTIFNPRLDPDGRIARALVDLLGRALGAAS